MFSGCKNLMAAIRFFLFCRLCIIFLGFDVLFVVFCVALACIIGIAVCCCLPCIIAILYAVADQVALTLTFHFFIKISEDHGCGCAYWMLWRALTETKMSNWGLNEFALPIVLGGVVDNQASGFIYLKKNQGSWGSAITHLTFQGV